MKNKLAQFSLLASTLAFTCSMASASTLPGWVTTLIPSVIEAAMEVVIQGPQIF